MVLSRLFRHPFWRVWLRIFSLSGKSGKWKISFSTGSTFSTFHFFHWATSPLGVHKPKSRGVHRGRRAARHLSWAAGHTLPVECLSGAEERSLQVVNVAVAVGQFARYLFRRHLIFSTMDFAYVSACWPHSNGTELSSPANHYKSPATFRMESTQLTNSKKRSVGDMQANELYARLRSKADFI